MSDLVLGPKLDRIIALLEELLAFEKASAAASVQQVDTVQKIMLTRMAAMTGNTHPQ